MKEFTFGIMGKILKFIARLLTIAAIVAAVLFLPQIKEHIPSLERRFEAATKPNAAPDTNIELQDPAKETFDWKYRGHDYSISLTLYRSLYDYYRTAPHQFQYQGDLPSDWQEQYSEMFLEPANSDQAITELSDAIRKEAAKNKLTDDQTVELALSFVQSIPYDEAGAEALAASGYEGSSVSYLPRYPYETLIDKKGICSDKSFLSYLLIRELGFGVALFEYPDQHHMAIGIQCPNEYSTYGSGYCYAETTAPENIIGIVPNLDAANKPLSNQKISYFGDSPANQTELADPNIFAKVTGKTYGGIVTTLKTEKNIAQLKAEIQSLNKKLLSEKQEIDSDMKALSSLKDKMDGYKSDKNYDKYNSLVSEYNSQVNAYKKETSAYNSDVNAYNAKVRSYNQLIKAFYP